MGFDDLLAALYPVTQFRTSLLDGSLPVVNLFSNLILPLWDAKDDKFGTTRIMRAASPLLSPSALKHAQDQFEQLGRAQAAVDALIELLDSNPSVTFGEVLHNVAKTGIFAIPDMLNVALAAATAEANDAEDKQERSDRDKAIAEFLTTPFLQVRAYAKYVSGKARFDTHQGVKGLEFPRVMVVMDDHEARGFLFKYEKLGGRHHDRCGQSCGRQGGSAPIGALAAQSDRLFGAAAADLLQSEGIPAGPGESGRAH